MDRLGMFSSPQFGTYSLPSLAEGSEPISEAEEINEVRSLHDRGVRAAKINDFKEAMKNYNEALEIDDKDTSVLHARSLAYLQMGDFNAALLDAETIIGIKPQSAQGYLLQGLAYQQMNQFKDAINSLLTALELEPNNADKLTNHIAATVARFCNISKDLAKSLKAMDAYNKLSEVGVVLYQSARYEMCIQILETAQQFQTNQKGITMRILLTLANAQSKLGNQNQAISLYQECLTLAVATHEQVYQTKSLVNIATLHLESGDTHQAIVYYRKLLCLEAELLEEAGSQEAMPDFWTKELQCGLHLNLSIAYKTIGNMSSAIIHAKRYNALAEKFGLDKRSQAESHHNTGMLNEILSNLPAALDCYESYLKMSKQNCDKRGMAQAYGCLGGVHAGLCNWPTAVMYHQQHISMATAIGDTRMVAMANEMLGDTYMLKEDFDKAVKQYEIVVNACTHNESRTKAMALCKLGRAYRALGRSQYSLYFFEQAITLADDLDFADVRMMADFHQACIQCTSTQLSEIEHAQKSFSKLIPFFEKKIAEHDEENSHCPKEYYKQLSQCYDGMLTVLAKMGDKEEALQYAEAHRKRTVTQLPNYHVTCAGVAHFHDVHHEAWTYDRMHRVVSQQSGTVLFYSLLEHTLLLWVLQPGVGLVRFYTGRSFKETSMKQQVINLLNELLEDRDQSVNLTKCESRALPLRNAHLDHLRKQNMKRVQTDSAKKDEVKQKEKMEEKSASLQPSPVMTPPPKKSPQRQLYEILIAPVEDILMKMEEPRNLVIVPDKELHHCPFSALQDWRGTYISKRFNLSYIPCLLQLDRVVQNEQAALRRRDDLDFERTQSRKGGLRKLISQALLPGNSNPLMISPLDNYSPISPGFDVAGNNLNLKQVSNPRLLTSGVLQTPNNKPLSRQAYISREGTFRSGGTLSPPGVFEKPGITPAPPTLPDINENVSGVDHHTVGVPAAPSKVLSSHTYSTVTTRTWTGTDITTSTQVVTTFQQLSDKEKCVVFGVPKLPESILVHGRPWKPLNELKSAKRELNMVAELLDTDPITNDAATKQRFLEEIKNAAIIHIATHACIEEGMLLVTPDPNLADRDADDGSHLVTVEDILTSKLQAQLVVISGGFTPVRKSFIDDGYRLPAVFLAAGAQSVLMTQWQVPDVAMEKFFFHFYHSMKKEDHISGAFSAALSALRSDDRFKAVSVWGAFMLVGHDSQVKLTQIQHAMLDQRIDRAEKELEEETGKEILNPKSAIPHVPSKEENYEQLQQFLGDLLRNHHNQPRVIPALIDMLDAALKRLHTEDNNKVTAQLTMEVSGSLPAIQFLKRLGFHFQARGSHLTSPYIVFPHWNTDDLLIPSYDALRALYDLASDSDCSHALINCLPLSQDNISLMIDLLSITKHATEVQLKVSDLSVKPLWQTSQTRQLLLAVGLHQIGLLLTFNSMPTNKQLLTSLLQLLLSVSCHKSPVLLYRLDVSLLGRETDSKPSSLSDTQAKLPSLTPLILPRNQLRMSTPWLTSVEQPDEMMEKMKLARSKSDLADTYHKQLERAKTWHQTSVVAQANESLGEFGRAKTTPSRVKVLPGSSASQKRIPLHRDPILILRDIDQRRDYAHHVLNERLHDIGGRHRDHVMKLFLPYVKT